MQKSISGQNSSFSPRDVQTVQPGSSAKSKKIISPFGENVSTRRHSAEKDLRVQFDFGQLPIEMVREIILNATSSSDLCALCLVCKVFHGWLTPRLYESVLLSSAEQIICFSSTLSRNPSLGSIVRDLCMFESVKRHEAVLSFLEEDGDIDDGSDWTPEADGDASTGSDSDESVSEAEFEDSDAVIDNLNGLIHGPFGFGYGILIHSHETSSQPGPSTILPPGNPYERQSVHAERNLWMESLSPMITSESVVYVHACAIMGSCPSLRTLYLPWSGSSATTCLRALLPFTRLQELAVYRISDLGLTFRNLQSASILMDLSSIQRLTIFNTSFQTLSADLPNILPALTHLRISLNLSADMAACLSRFPRLTHLWFTPPQGESHPQVDFEAFLLDVQTRCRRIKRVRVDFPLGSTDFFLPNSFGAVNWHLFPFVRIRTSVLPNAEYMWEQVSDPETRFHDRPHGEDASIYMYNAYAECIKNYWHLALTGGGWDD